MVAQAPGGSGQGNQGGSGNQQGGSGTSTTTTSQSSNQATTTSNPFSSTASSLSPTSTSASSSSGVSKGVVIGGVVGGICALLGIALLITCCLQRRKKKQLALENGSAQPVTYAGLNSAFSGVPFRNSQTHQTLIPGAAQHGSGHSSNSSSPALRGGALSDPTLSAAETDLFLPTYAESQATHSPISNVSPISARATTDLHNMSPQTPGAISHLYSASPRTPGAAFSHNIINPQFTGASEFQTITPQTTGGQAMRPPQFPQTGRSRDTINTMGFPVEEDFEMLRLQHPVPNIPVAIVAPIPRHPLVHQDSLARVVRDGLVPSPSPAFSVASAADPRTRVLSHMTGMSESPVLGDPNRARFPAQQLQPSGLGLGVSRNDTQRTVSTVSSMGVSVVSDGELDRLGVGSRVAGGEAEPRIKPLRYH